MITGSISPRRDEFVREFVNPPLDAGFGCVEDVSAVVNAQNGVSGGIYVAVLLFNCL
jgi:hypothetical protein